MQLTYMTPIDYIFVAGTYLTVIETVLTLFRRAAQAGADSLPGAPGGVLRLFPAGEALPGAGAVLQFTMGRRARRATQRRARCAECFIHI